MVHNLEALAPLHQAQLSQLAKEREIYLAASARGPRGRCRAAVGPFSARFGSDRLDLTLFRVCAPPEPPKVDEVDHFWAPLGWSSGMLKA